MPTNKYNWTEAKFNRYIKEGRGQGNNKDYLPWLMTYDVPSLGRRTRDPGWESFELGASNLFKESATILPFSIEDNYEQIEDTLGYESDLHDHHDRIAEYDAQEGHQKSSDVPIGRSGL